MFQTTKPPTSHRYLDVPSENKKIAGKILDVPSEPQNRSK